MNRTEFQELAEERVKDARNLLDAPSKDSWSGAYYLAGYALECGLKACVLALVERRPGVIFDDKRFSEKCFSHDLNNLIKLADLEAAHRDIFNSNPEFANFWNLT